LHREEKLPAKELNDAAMFLFISLVKRHWAAINDKCTTKTDILEKI